MQSYPDLQSLGLAVATASICLYPLFGSGSLDLGHNQQYCRSSLRPDPVAGVSRGSYMNITVSIALYATMCKEQGLPLRCAHRSLLCQ